MYNCAKKIKILINEIRIYNLRNFIKKYYEKSNLYICNDSGNFYWMQNN